MQNSNECTEQIRFIKPKLSLQHPAPQYAEPTDYVRLKITVRSLPTTVHGGGEGGGVETKTLHGGMDISWNTVLTIYILM